ncbi:unnamed protein product [Chrysoparadoxa australica]
MKVAALVGCAMFMQSCSAWVGLPGPHLSAPRQARTRVVMSAEQPRRPPLTVLGRAGPTDAPPSYDAADSNPFNAALLGYFRSKLADECGGQSPTEGYDGLMEMILALNSKFMSQVETQQASRRTLQALFPSWLPGAFAVMFSKPFPGFSNRLNAWVTWWASQWLMGPSELNNVEETNDGSSGKGQGLLVTRPPFDSCRFLEHSGCASVCLNNCKIPTEEFFAKDMGLLLEMKPDYEDFSCQFSFGKAPEPRESDQVFNVACFEQCPSQGSLRKKCHQIVASK